MNAQIPTGSRGFKRLVAIILPVWFLLALAGSLLGMFSSAQRPPGELGAAAVVPVVLFALACAASGAWRRFVMGADPRVLTLLQTWRALGVVFVILYYRGVLPGSFALPAGWGDIAIGVTAPFVAWKLAGKAGAAGRAFVAWNVLGVLDLVMAVCLGILSSNSPLGILAGERTTQVMGQFPLSLIPTFFVPLLLILHLVCLGQAVRRGGREEWSGAVGAM